ncbi:MAG: hypothetical protein ACYSWP_22160 [Planctomycetota bacterium]|jgi:hypothetical protein
MKTIKIMLITMILLSTVGVTLAEERELGVTFSAAFASKWLSDGIEVYEEDGVYHESVALDLYGTGFGFVLTRITN